VNAASSLLKNRPSACSKWSRCKARAKVVRYEAWISPVAGSGLASKRVVLRATRQKGHFQQAARLAFAVAMMAAAAAPAMAAGAEAQYDEFGRRPSQSPSELSLPDPVLDYRWPMPEPGGRASQPELLDSDEAKLDPLHEDVPDNDVPPAPVAPGAPALPDELPESVEELLRRGPAPEVVVPLMQGREGDQSRGAIAGGDPAEE